jgi:hypothetical protein
MLKSAHDMSPAAEVAAENDAYRRRLANEVIEMLPEDRAEAYGDLKLAIDILKLTPKPQPIDD